MESSPPSQPMPLLAHLRELRRRLVYSVLAIVAIFPVYALFSREIYAFLVDSYVNDNIGSSELFFKRLK